MQIFSAQSSTTTSITSTNPSYALPAQTLPYYYQPNAIPQPNLLLPHTNDVQSAAATPGVIPAAAADQQQPQQQQVNAAGAVVGDIAPAQQPPQQPRFPNIIQEEVENRDWLDLFYSTSRLMILMALVYFYSSPTRCLIVISFIILYYM